MQIGQAIEALREGQHVTRSGWNGKDRWLGLQEPDSESAMTLPYIYIKTVQNDFVPWLASQTDILADDWVVIKQVIREENQNQAMEAPIPGSYLNETQVQAMIDSSIVKATRLVGLNDKRADLMQRLLNMDYTPYQAASLSDLPYPAILNKPKEG